MNKVILRKKPEYIRKYDYIRYFYRPKDEWFYPTKELENYIHDLMIATITKNQSSNMNDFDLEDENQKAYDNENEIDVYSFVEELKDDHIDLDNSNPKIFEGNIIDKKSKEYIKQYFADYFKKNNIHEFNVVDFSTFKLNNKQQFIKTMKYLESHKYAIMFQPTFIARNKAIAKPDALINVDGKLFLVETKGTTNPKLNHLIDIYYQKQIIEVALKDKDYYFDDYYLCIVKYELLGLKQISFVLTRNCSLKKNGFDTSIDKRNKKNEKKESEKLTLAQATHLKSLIRLGESDKSPDDTSIKSLLDNHPSLPSRSIKGYEEIYTEFLESSDKFWNIIDELYNYQIDNSIPSLTPSRNYKTRIKDNDYWLALRDYYYFLSDKNGINKYPSLQFSGKLIRYSDSITFFEDNGMTDLSDDEFIKNLLLNKNILNFEHGMPPALNKYLNTICKDNEILTYGICSDALKHFNRLKSKKVYFDFESLNIATRVVNNYPPFMQVVNQVSVIFDHGDKNLQVMPYLVIDPINGINKEDFKKIINAILPSEDLDECRKYSYVVYNQNFECIRLKEMAKYINETEYNKKVNVINENIYDLADFFNLEGKDKNFQVVFKELKGFYSIKKVLPLVEKYDNYSFKVAGCKNYKTELIQITNGSEAQNVSTQRFFGLLNDQDWKTTVENLGKYCDNDVRAMVAVEYFLNNILNGKIKH